MLFWTVWMREILSLSRELQPVIWRASFWLYERITHQGWILWRVILNFPWDPKASYSVSREESRYQEKLINTLENRESWRSRQTQPGNSQQSHIHNASDDVEASNSTRYYYLDIKKCRKKIGEKRFRGALSETDKVVNNWRYEIYFARLLHVRI